MRRTLALVVSPGWRRQPNVVVIEVMLAKSGFVALTHAAEAGEAMAAKAVVISNRSRSGRLAGALIIPLRLLGFERQDAVTARGEGCSGRWPPLRCLPQC